MNAILLTACLLSAGPASGPARESVGVDGLPVTGGTMSGDIDLNDYDLLNPDVIRQLPPASDVATEPVTIGAGDAYPLALVNINGAPLALCSGTGVREIKIVQATALANTLTFTVFNSLGTSTATTITTGTEWNCLTNNPTCAAALEAYLDANIDGFTATTVGDSVFIVPDYDTCGIIVQPANGGGTAFLMTTGTDGDFVLASDLRMNEYDVYNAGQFGLIDTGSLDWSTRSTINSPGDGQELHSTDAGTEGYCSDYTVDGVYSLYGRDCYDPATFILDNANTGADHDSGTLTFRSNEWDGVDDWQCDAELYLESTGGDPYLSIKVDDSCAAGAGTLAEILGIYDDIVVLGGDIEMAGNELTDLTDGVVSVAVDLGLTYGGSIFAPAVATDAVAYQLATEAGNAYHLATVNPDGAPNLQCGGIGVKSMAVVQATADQSTITITTTDAAGTYTSTPLTLYTAPAVGDIACETSNVVCAGAIVTYLSTAGLSVTAEAVAAQVYLIPATTLCSLGLSSADGGGTKFVLTNGADGQILIPNGVSSVPGIAFASDPDSGLGLISGGVSTVYGGANRQIVSITSITSYVANNTIPAAGMRSWDGSTEHRAPADNQLQVCNAAETQCFTLGASAADVMSLLNKAGTGYGTLLLGKGSGDDIRITTAGTIAGGIGGYTDDGIHFSSRGSAAGHQNYNFIFTTNALKGQDFDHDEVSAGPNILVHSVLDPSTDNGEYVSLMYDGLRGGTPEGDRAVTDFAILGGNANAQATGANRNGADLNLAAGIRTMQFVCDNFAWAADDEVYITVNGVTADIIEGVDFTVGISDDATCVAFGAALVTEAIGLTPDCTTLAGTCYLTPDEDLLRVDSIALVDGAADGVFATTVEGTDGQVVVDTVLRNGIHTFTMADDGAGTHASGTLIPTANFVLCDCDDAHGCTVTMGETGMSSGTRITIVGETGTHCDFADTDGVSNLSGALVVSDDDVLELTYSVDEWVQSGELQNN